MSLCKLSWPRLIIGLCIVSFVAVAAALLFVARELDTLFLEGNLTEAFSGKDLDVSSRANYYSLCLLRKAVVLPWDWLISKNLDNIFVMLYFSGIHTPNSVVFLQVQDDVRQLATAILALSSVLIWVMPAHGNGDVAKRNRVGLILDLVFRLGALALWGWLIYLRGDFASSPGGDALPAYVAIAVTANQKIWLPLLVAGTELVFVGIFPVSILLSKNGAMLFLIAISIFLGWIASLLIPALGEAICQQNLDFGISPFR